MVQIRIKQRGLKKIPNYAKLTGAAIQKVNQEQAELVKKDLLKPTATWQHDVEARAKQTRTGFTVIINDKVYAILDAGSKPHDITPKRAKALRFNTRFRSKTMPNKLTARKGFNAPPAAFAKKVEHPGTAPRNFKKQARERLNKRYPTALRKAIKQALK